MENFETLSRHGLFDAKVPRYTSYPPANHFQNDVGRKRQSVWLENVGADEAVSLYFHIPFCKRLCWFCACRTQGTKTLRPVEAYVEILKSEIASVRANLPSGVRMERLHLGGGTPTILVPGMMADLLDAVFAAFNRTADFAFSVEIDPTEAAPALLDTLITYGMNRASIGVQDFAPEVQAAIGRPQSLEQTTFVVEHLRVAGLTAINLDLLYGLPHQTMDSFRATLDHVLAMSPDRLAIYGYAHVPWMSKRQVMIKEEALPNTQARFELATLASEVMQQYGYLPIGIDHFAKPGDTLAQAQADGTLRRNFQGYTDDTSETLIGFGASAISKFRKGYMQNAVATSAYQQRVTDTGFAGHKGYEMSPKDDLIAAMIEALMCRFVFPTAELQTQFPGETDAIRQTAVALMARYADVFALGPDGLTMRPETYPLARVIAYYIDAFTKDETAHAAAI